MDTSNSKISPKGVIRSYLVSIGKYRWAFFAVLVAYGLGSIGGDILAPLLYRHIIDIVSGAGSRQDVAGQLFGIFGWLIVLILSYHLMYRSGDFLVAYAESRTMEDLNNRAFAAFMRQGHGFFTDRFTGSLVAQARRYVRGFEDVADIFIFNFWMPGISLAGVIVTLFVIDPRIGVIFALWVPIYIVAALWITKRKLPYDTESATQDSLVTASLADVLTNAFTVKTFATERSESDMFADVTQRDERARRRAWYFNNLLIAAQITLFGLLEIAGMYVVIRMWIAGIVSAGTVVLVQMYIGAIFHGVFSLGRSFGRLVKSVADASEMVATIDRAGDEESRGKPQAFPIRKGRVSFRGVSFRYPNGSEVFRDFSIDIMEGEKIGLVGVSGSGKSTFTKLLLRFISPFAGSIRIDGSDIMDMRTEDLRRAIAYVPQEPLLFHRSLFENIAYGRSGASRDDVFAAAKRAQAHDFIMSLPDGYETLVGERGIKLSGGQRQRVAIARAILKDAPILVLDEATSALDSESEHAIQEALAELMRDRTAIVIAHRLSTIRRMDRIIVLDVSGRIAEEGTHDELLTVGGLYSSLWNRQTGAFIDEEE